MSASLVGSEMCIRDRETAAQVLHPLFAKRYLYGYEPYPWRGSLIHAIWTVSYTHLTLPTICSV
eukprot:15286135-Alexandrium_andersonii.AAC.1